MFEHKESKYYTRIILLLALLVMAMIFLGTYSLQNSSKNLQQAYANQLKYRTLAMELRDSSDYLTNEVRSFAVTGELSHFRKYWDEARNEKHREKAIAEMEKADLPNDEQRYLQRAKYFSDTLMHIEISSMRLVLEDKDVTTGMYSDDKQMQEWVAYVRSYPLEKDYQCAADKKKQQSEMMLYGVTYETYKELIDSNVEKFQSELNGRLDQTVKKAAGASKKAFFIQLIFGFCEIAVLMFILILFQKSYINPVMKYKKTIERQQGRRQIYIQPEGVWELRQFAEEFNALSQDMLEELAKSERIERELLEAKKQAEDANHVKTQFLTQMSHELRTPLNTISGYLFLMEDTKMSGEQRRYAENMHLATDILLEEINEILDYSKLQSGKMTFENKNFSLYQLTENLQAIFENEAEKRNLFFRVEVGKDVPEYVHGDPLRLKQVLTNLIYNGIKFTKEGGVTLRIQTQHFFKKKYMLEFEVMDTGIGIKKERRKDIFQAFAQADESITRKYGGTGLGLPICGRIVQDMSAGRHSLMLESEEGKGSRFYFNMEFAYGHEDPKRKRGHVSQRKRKRNLSVLIVDDHQVNLILEAEVLHKFGYLADVESDAEKVLERLEEKKYDIIFMDISMPKISGYELSRQIRQNELWANTAIIALTANIGEDVKEKVKEAGMNGYLPKPIPMEKLKELLEKYTDQVLEIKPAVAGSESTDLVAFHQLESQFYGEKEAVKELLAIFVEDNDDFEKKIQDLAARTEWEKLEMELHRLKGVSGNLQCKPLAAAAQECLNEVRKKRWKPEKEEMLMQVFRCTMKVIEEYQSQD